MNDYKLKIQNKARLSVGGRSAKRGGRAAIEERARLGDEVTIVRAQSSSRERAASMSDVGTLAAMDAFAGGARRRPARLPPPPPFVPPPPPHRHDRYYMRRHSPLPLPSHGGNLTLFTRTNGTGTYHIIPSLS